MMKRKARLISACVAFIVLIGAYFAIQAIFSSPQQSEEQSPATLFSIDKKSVDSISFTAGGENLKLIKESDGFWYLSDDKSFPVDQDIVTSMLTVISPMYQIMTVSEECSDPSIYGLDKGVEVTVKYSGKELGFTIGDTSSEVEGCYLSLKDGKTVYLADVSSSVAFTHKNKLSLISFDQYPVFTVNSLSSIKLSFGEESLELSKTENQFKAHLGAWAKLENQKAYPLDESLSDKLLYLVKGLSFKECVYFKPDESTLEELFKDGTTLDVSYIHSAKNEDETTTQSTVSFTLLIGKKSDSKDYYAMLKDSDTVCTLSAESVEDILAFSKNEILDKRIFGFDESGLESIKLTKGNESYLLERIVTENEKDESTLTQYKLDGKEISSEASEEITSLISKAKADSIGDFTITSEAEISFEFKLTDKSSYTVNFYSLDDESFVVESDGLCFKSLKKSTIEDIIKLFAK